MFLLLSFLCSINISIDATALHDNYSGTYVYQVDTPEGKVDGSMTLKKEGNTYVGTLVAYGQEFEMQNMVWNGHQLTFDVDVAGYKSKVSGTFSDTSYDGMIEVEGFKIPIKATKQ